VIINERYDVAELKEKRMETLHDYLCWNLKLISTEIILRGVKKLEEYAYNSGIFE
jgi:hypothetical protein